MTQEESKNTVSFILVDDDPHMLYFLERSFKSLGIAVTIERLNNGEEFLTLLEEQKKNPVKKIDCILLDLNMPRKNGWEALIEMQQKSLGSGIPIVMLSHSRQSDIEGLKRLGAAAFLEKPIGLEEYKTFAKTLLSYAAASSAESPKGPDAMAGNK